MEIYTRFFEKNENVKMLEEEGSSTAGCVEQENEEKEKEEKMKVNSKGIVKYTMADPPMLPYPKLRQDTDLNVAPANWLRDGRFSDGFPQRRKPVEFSSFGIAHTFLDSIGDVDVISDAENIKKLLKMPYSKGEVSLAVHRIGRTLLLDELDLPGLLSYSSQSEYAANLGWLYDLYCEQNGIPKGADFRKKKNKDQAKQRHIYSKFLHYSIQRDAEEHGRGPYEHGRGPYVSDSAPSTSTGSKANLKGPGGVTSHEHVAAAASSVPLPEKIKVFPVVNDSGEDVLPEPKQMSSFERNVLWTFEDIHMLVGSNMPIFGGGKYPAVSLRLRDCGKPISVLTGLDYWLDNLMCNVPEVAMCYHLDGIVQYYDLYKTEDLPNLEESGFSPKVVKDIAQNMLSFMKSNCTQDGHTYWLFKANDSEVVKLYDLTSICDQTAEEGYENPFTVPVAMLFFRAAKNMMKRAPLNARDQGTVRLLLNNCLVLLGDHKFPEIVASANYLLSDLYSPDNVHTLPALDTESERSSREDLTLEDFNPVDTSTKPSDGATTLDIRELSTPGMYQDDFRQMAKMLTGNVETRCKAALAHIVKGLLSLKLAPSTEVTEEIDNDSNHSDQSPPHSPTSSTALSIFHASSLEPSASRPVPLKGTDSPERGPLILVKPVEWRSQSTTILLRKAASVYHSMACVSNTKGKYGRGLRFCKLAFKCFEAYKTLGKKQTNADGELLRSVFCSCADAYLMLAKCGESLAVHHEDFRHMSRDDDVLSDAAGEYASDLQDAFYCRVDFNSCMETNLVNSVDFYEAALDRTGRGTKDEEFVNITRRVGNVKNELGVHFMNRAATMMGHGDEPSIGERDMWRRSFSSFESGIRAFEAIDDRANKALLFSNSGRLMRLCALSVGGDVGKDETSRGEFSQEERTYFSKAFEFYNKALRSLGERKVCADVWDAVTWELSGAYYSMAILLQDYPPLSLCAQHQVEREVTELMMKALKLCEPTGKGSVVNIRPQAPGDLERRTGTIHHRLASLYHNAYRNEVVDQAKKKARSLAELHYTKACLYFKPDTFPCECIRVLLERVAMCEHQVSLHTGSSPSVKTLLAALDFILDTKSALEGISLPQEKRKPEPESDKEAARKTEKTLAKEKVKSAGKSDEGKGTIGDGKSDSRKGGEKYGDVGGLGKSSTGGESTEKENPDSVGGKEMNDETSKGMKSLNETNARDSSKDTEESTKTKLEDGNDVLKAKGGSTVTEDRKTPSESSNSNQLDNELKVLIPILESRLNNTLKALVKIRSQKGKGKHADQIGVETAKRMYSVALRGSTGTSSGDIRLKARTLGLTLARLEEMRKKS